MRPRRETRLSAAAGVLILALAAGTGPARGQNRPAPLDPARAYQGIAVLSSAIEHGTPASEIQAFVAECKIDLVVIDFAWITYHWPRTDLGAVERLAASLHKAGVTVAAMYRPRAMRPEGIRAHFARGPDGKVARSHNDLCLAYEDSLAWGAAWGEKILNACASVDRIVLYNVRPTCACEKCRGGRGQRHVGTFLAECRTRWNRIRSCS